MKGSGFVRFVRIETERFYVNSRFILHAHKKYKEKNSDEKTLYFYKISQYPGSFHWK